MITKALNVAVSGSWRKREEGTGWHVAFPKEADNFGRKEWNAKDVYGTAY